jgi:phosphate acetyltransferase
MSVDLMSQLLEAASKGRQVSIVYPEGTDERILAAAAKVRDLGFAKPILIGDPNAIKKASTDLIGIEIVDTADAAKREELAKLFEDETGFPAEAAAEHLRDPVNLAACMVRFGQVDTLVGGINTASSVFLLSLGMYIGYAEGISTSSSCAILDVPNWDGGENGLVAWADPAVCIKPDAKKLADIAICSADTVKALVGWEPRVAMLSYSTTGSAEGEDVDKVREALGIIRAARPSILVEGELQLDAAVVPDVSRRKVRGENLLMGTANVLIAPDINAANIGIKIIERFAGAVTFGPVLQGFAKPVSDISRGASADIALRASIMVSLLVQNL